MKWAKCNIGAEKETDYGYYFQWGDIVDNSNADCSWASYKYCNGSNTTLTKYNTSTSYGENTDNKTTLDLEDDAARANMGGVWRMPTSTEFQELLDGTTNEWITNYNGTGVNGKKFTSKTDTSKYIFIPAAGLYSEGSFKNVGYEGNVWSSSLYTSYPNSAWYLYFSSQYCYIGNNYRCIGQTVRGVCK